MQVTTPTKDTNQGHEVQGMQVTTRTRDTPTRTRGSRHAGNHTNQGHTNQGHEVQGMQVTTQKNNLKDKKQQRKIKKRYFLYFCTSTKISLK